MTERLVLRTAQRLELELVLAGGWGSPPRFGAPSAGEAMLTVPSELASAQRLELLDAEGTGIGSVHVSSTGIGVAGHWVAGDVARSRPFGHLDFAELRATQTPRESGIAHSREAIVVTGSVPNADDARWRGVQQDVSVVVLDRGSTDALARSIETVRAVGRTPVVLPSPDCSTRSAAQWLEAVDTAVRNLVSQKVSIWETDRPTGDGLVILLSGLSGSGKSTIAKRLSEALSLVDGRMVSLLDGDEVRLVLSSGLGFSREDRSMNIHRIGWVAALASKHGGVAICAPIAPYTAMRDDMRAQAEAVGDFLLVHVSTPLEICEQRDRKGLYAKARRGEIAQFTGISDPYDIPVDADLSIDTSLVEVDDAVALILDEVRARVTSASAPVPDYMI